MSKAVVRIAFEEWVKNHNQAEIKWIGHSYANAYMAAQYEGFKAAYEVGKILNKEDALEFTDIQNRLKVAKEALEFYLGGDDEGWEPWLKRMKKDMGHTANKALLIINGGK